MISNKNIEQKPQRKHKRELVRENYGWSLDILNVKEWDVWIRMPNMKKWGV